MRQLGDREDVDEIEEQLEEGRALLALPTGTDDRELRDDRASTRHAASIRSLQGRDILVVAAGCSVQSEDAVDLRKGLGQAANADHHRRNRRGGGLSVASSRRPRGACRQLAGHLPRAQRPRPMSPGTVVFPPPAGGHTRSTSRPASHPPSLCKDVLSWFLIGRRTGSSRPPCSTTWPSTLAQRRTIEIGCVTEAAALHVTA